MISTCQAMRNIFKFCVSLKELRDPSKVEDAFQKLKLKTSSESVTEHKNLSQFSPTDLGNGKSSLLGEKVEP